MPLMLLALACAPEEEPYPFDKIKDRGDDTGDTDPGDTDPGDTDPGDTDDTDDTGSGTPEPYTLAFEGAVVTVSGTPLGLSDAVRETRVSGSMTWNRLAADTEDDPQRGLYDHHGSGGFTLSVGGRVVGGSGSPQVEVQDLSSDTFRFVDGAEVFDQRARVMTIDGADDPALGVWFAVTDGSGAALSDDDLPAGWPFPAITELPHTFSVQDDGGTLLLQLDVLAPG